MKNNKLAETEKDDLIAALNKCDVAKCTKRAFLMLITNWITWSILFYFAFVQNIYWVEVISVVWGYFAYLTSIFAIGLFLFINSSSGVNFIGRHVRKTKKTIINHWMSQLTSVVIAWVFLTQGYYILATVIVFFVIMFYYASVKSDSK
jgi:hypothetical protein